jgi:4'-phosphopantetheinyl transferase
MVCSPLLRQLGHQAHVWFIIPEAIRDASQLEACRSILSHDEVRRYGRFRFEQDRHRFLVSHAFVRNVLSRYIGLAPHEWVFSHSAHGKPEISNPGIASLRFNLTHTPGLVACVVNLNGECGIDAEKITERHAPIAVAKRMFSNQEYLQHESLAGRAQLEYFFERWTLREAYVKARGIGIHFPTRKLCFHVAGPDTIQIEFEPDIGDSNNNWQLQLLRPTEQHITAVAVARKEQQRKTMIARIFDFSE